MKKEENKKLSKEKIYKLFEKGEINTTEFDELRKALLQDNLNIKLLSAKKREIKVIYREGELSISDTIAYETLRLLDRNSRNTGSMVWIIVINIVAIFFGVIVINASN